MQEERIGYDKALESLEEAIKAKEVDLSELLLLSHDAYHAKDLAGKDLATYETHLQKMRDNRVKQLSEKQ